LRRIRSPSSGDWRLSRKEEQEAQSWGYPRDIAIMKAAWKKGKGIDASYRGFLTHPVDLVCCRFWEISQLRR